MNKSEKRILVIDDEELMLEFLKKIWRSLGEETFGLELITLLVGENSPADEKPVVERILAEKPDLVVADLNEELPYGKDGFSIVREMQARGIPAILSSNHQEYPPQYSGNTWPKLPEGVPFMHKSRFIRELPQLVRQMLAP